MTREEAIQAWEQMRSEIDKENWLFVGTINPLMIDMAIEALQAEPVKRGKWTVDEKHTEEIYTNPVYCSVCGKDVVIDYGEYAPYCPNCGAKMDGERSEE